MTLTAVTLSSMPTTTRPVHYLGPDLTAPCRLPFDAAEQAEDRRTLSPVLADVTCEPCVDVLRHA